MRSKSTQINANLNPKKIKKHQHQTSKNSLKIKITITTNQRKSIKIKSKPTHPNPTQSTSKPNHQNHINIKINIKINAMESKPFPSNPFSSSYSIAAKRFGTPVDQTKINIDKNHQTRNIPWPAPASQTHADPIPSHLKSNDRVSDGF